MNHPKSILVLTLASTLVAACGGVDAASGATEPLLVTGARFVAGPLPEGEQGPAVLTLDSRNNLVRPGQRGKRLTGDVAKGAYAVALRFADIGTGFYVLPVGAPSQETQGALTWEAVYDIASDVPPGEHRLHIVGIDGQGRVGPASELPMLVQGPHGDAKVAVSLSWDTNADLDLHIVSPSGKVLGPKHVNTGLVEDGGVSPGSGQLDRDSNAGCVSDGHRRENVIWSEAPEPGTYLVRVNMFHSCGQPASSFVVSVWLDGERKIERKGRLLDSQAGSGPGLFVTEFKL